MKILVPGSTGQLGQALLRLASGHEPEIIGLTHQELDITRADEVNRAVRAIHPDAVINAAAYTAVDRAESEPDLAFAVNRDGAANLAQACADMDIPLIHISTDYVFNGCKETPWTENDPPDPINVYGASKLAGERAVQDSFARHTILRTSWVFSATGSNFVRTILKLGQEKSELRVVDDQIGKPTSADELARLILGIIPQLDGKEGIYHVAQPEAVSWHGFATTILAEARRLGLEPQAKCVRPVHTSDWPTPARRPRNSTLNCQKFETAFGMRIQPWRDSLPRIIQQIAKRETSDHSHATR